jgi:hypothetical protein
MIKYYIDLKNQAYLCLNDLAMFEHFIFRHEPFMFDCNRPKFA